ncbi:TIGR04141 family sporadically distributed protein [Enterococcus casseliflavus]|uniref:TIGR04141 family sporadically distributed protein n=1 Tax=Enterococcus casseliflavus TaxID=37734 RepID=UPI003D6B389A
MTELSIFMLKNEKSSSINSFIEDKYLEHTSKKLFEKAEDIEESNLAVFPLNNQLKVNYKVTGKIFILQERQEKGKLSESVNKFSEENLNLSTSNILNKPLIIIKISRSSIYAISYSYGYTLLKREYIVHDFGLNIARKNLDLDTIKRIKNTNFADNLYTSSFSSSNKINLNEISNSQSIPNIVDEVFGKMTVKFMDREKNIRSLNMFVTSKDSIKIKGNFSIPEHLVPILKELGEMYREKKSGRTFLDKEILTVPPKKKDWLERRFDDHFSKLMSIFQKNSNELKSSNLEKLAIDLPLNKVKENIEDLEFRIHSICRPDEYFNFIDYSQEEIFSKIFSYFLKYNIQEFVGKLKSIKVSIKDSDSSDDRVVGDLFSCLYMDYSHNSEKYILYQGNWLSVNKNVWAETRDFINSISAEVHGIDFDEFNKNDKDEGAYNVKISRLASNNGVLCLDKKNFSSKDVPGGFAYYDINTDSKMEPCDILKVNNDSVIFCHVKRGTASAGLSHLLSQARASCLSIRKSEEFVGHINSVISTVLSEEKIVSLNEKNLKSSKVILGCIVPENKVQSKNSIVFPVLFSLNLVALVSALSAEKFEVSLVKIPDKNI